jgi:hypothetical protein
MDRNYLVIPCTLSDCDIKIDTCTLVDCGCTILSFINEAFACQYNFPYYKLQNLKIVEVLYSHPISFGNITEYVKLQ